MKIFVLHFFLAALLPYGNYCFAQSGGGQPPSHKNERTTVQWLPDTLFFGDVYEGAILLDSFMVTNTGDQPYLIRDVKTSCDCTVLRFPKHPVMPGEKAVMRLEFDSSGKAGHTQPGIIIYDNSAPNSRNILYLKGNIIPRKKPRNKLGEN